MLLWALLVIALSMALLYIFRWEILRFAWYVAPFMGETFTPEKWAEGRSCEGLTEWQCAEKEFSCPRGPMVRSLIRNHLAPGTERSAIFALLGEADGTLYDRPECSEWSLGMCSGMKIDYDALFVCFDTAGRVTEAGHVQH